jgi:nucleoside-diphosphate-sugar epimerase
MSETLLILGAGFSGLAIARAARRAGWRVFGTTRSPERFDELRAAGAEPLVFDGEEWNRSLAEALSQATCLVASIAPGRSGDPAINTGRAALVAAPRLQWIGYLSTVGVYGDRSGGWVDETSEPRPASKRSIDRLAAEIAWTALAVARETPIATLRLSGIFGPGRNALANLAEGTAKRVVKPGQVFNRIHVDDIAEATLFLAKKRAGGIYNVTDNEPAPPQDVVAFAAGLMGAEAPPEVPFSDAGLSEMGRSFYAENKRVSNRKLTSLGYRFRHPDYRTALSAMWANGSWRG